LLLRYDYRYDVLRATHLALIAPVLFFDMTMAVLVNATPVPFLFTDGPAICTNLFLRDFRELQGITGYGSRGLIAFMPLCEFLAVMFYDGGAYTLRPPAMNPVDLNAVADVGLLRTAESITVASSPFAPRKTATFAERKATIISAPVLNAFQALAVDDVIYFGNPKTVDYVQQLHAAHRLAERQAVGQRRAWATDGESELVHHFEKAPPLRPTFSFLRLRRMPTDDDRRFRRMMSDVEARRSPSYAKSRETLQLGGPLRYRDRRAAQ
jgi:hypothetical protein